MTYHVLIFPQSLKLTAGNENFTILLQFLRLFLSASATLYIILYAIHSKKITTAAHNILQIVKNKKYSIVSSTTSWFFFILYYCYLWRLKSWVLHFLIIQFLVISNFFFNHFLSQQFLVGVMPWVTAAKGFH